MKKLLIYCFLKEKTVPVGRIKASQTKKTYHEALLTGEWEWEKPCALLRCSILLLLLRGNGGKLAWRHHLVEVEGFRHHGFIALNFSSA